MKHKKPVSHSQLAANRANAAKSTGPTTADGKAHSSQNAVKPGFPALAFSVRHLEDPDELANLKTDFVNSHHPASPAEMAAVERMAIGHQSILRASRLEAGLFSVGLNQTLTEDDTPFYEMTKCLATDPGLTRAQNRNWLVAEGMRLIVNQSTLWTVFLRYQAQAERLYRRAVEDFTRLRKLRDELQNEPKVDLQPQQESTNYTDPETKPFAPPPPRPPQSQPSSSPRDRKSVV